MSDAAQYPTIAPSIHSGTTLQDSNTVDQDAEVPFVRACNQQEELMDIMDKIIYCNNFLCAIHLNYEEGLKGKEVA